MNYIKIFSRNLLYNSRIILFYYRVISTMSSNCVLVLNCGSSSLKFSIIDILTQHVKITGLAEKLTTTDASITFKFADKKQQQALSSPFDHKNAIAALVKVLHEQHLAEKVSAIGHRVVHGGEKFSAPTLITNEVKQTITELAKLAPLHNPANLVGINAAEQCFENVPQVAIFDTAFHQTMPKQSFLYGIPYEMYQQHAIRKYGFHGTSHYFVAAEVAKQLNKPLQACNFITAHLGNGCSVTAIKNGESVDSSMGFTPLEGVMMGTRSGSIDPGIIFHLISQLNYSAEEVNQILNKKSGLLGVSQLSNDCRELENAMNEGNEQAKTALQIFCYQIAKSIAALTCGLTQLDAVIFTGGIGENSSFVRAEIAAHLSLLNIRINDEKNTEKVRGEQGNIAIEHSIPCWVMPTNEEWVIAEQTFQLINKDSH
jgi:acetate kinase